MGAEPLAVATTDAAAEPGVTDRPTNCCCTAAPVYTQHPPK